MNSVDVFLACYAKFGTQFFTRAEARELADDPKISDCMMNNATTRGYLIGVGPRMKRAYKFSRDGVAKVAELTSPVTPGVQSPDKPAHVMVGSKDPVSILKMIRRQLEEQIDQIDEALETIKTNDAAVANIEKIKALLS